MKVMQEIHLKSCLYLLQAEYAFGSKLSSSHREENTPNCMSLESIIKKTRQIIQKKHIVFKSWITPEENILPPILKGHYRTQKTLQDVMTKIIIKISGVNSSMSCIGPTLKVPLSAGDGATPKFAGEKRSNSNSTVEYSG